MNKRIEFNADLIRRYDVSGPRYTSYPTVNQFGSDITEDDYRMWADESNGDPIPRALSLYIHIPFCDTVCYYCACNKVVTKDHSKATAYLQRLNKEIATQGALFDKDRIVEQLHWGGGTPTFLANDEICNLMEVTRQHFSLLSNDEGEYSIEIDPRTVDYSKLKVLREVGFNRISIGLQDINLKVQQAVNRVQSKKLTLDVIGSARELGFKSINLDLIYGLPFQTEDSFDETVETVIEEMHPDRIAVYNYAHLPERFKPQRRISEKDLPTADEKLNILQRTINHLTDAAYVYIGMDHFARADDELALAQYKGNLHRNFQGYSTHSNCDLIGLGVSAISKVRDNYSQNVRKINEYYERIDSGKYPLESGIELEADDLLRQKIINQLMCHFVLDINELEQEWKFNFNKHFRSEIKQLQHMENDGLLTLDRKSLMVLPAGRLLVRNICMVFDHYLSDNKVRFSKVI